MGDQISDKLIEISSSEWKTLRDMYLCDWPTHALGYYTIENYVRWNKIKSDIKDLNIFSLNGDWQDDGTFVVVDRYEVLVNTLKTDSVERISRALRLLDWQHGLVFPLVLDRHHPAVLQAVHSKQLTIAFETQSILIHLLPRAEAAAFDVACPDGFSIRPITQEHANIVDEEWPFKHPASVFRFKRFIELNPNVGAFTDDGILVGWYLLGSAGTTTNLHVESNYRRLGLGKILAKSMAKKCAELGMDSMCPILVDNVVSRAMNERLGYKVIDRCVALGTKTLPEIDWNDNTE